MTIVNFKGNQQNRFSGESISKNKDENESQQGYLKNLNLSQKSESFKQHLRCFVTEEYGVKIESAEFQSDDKLEDVFNYVGIIVQPDLIKKGMRNRTYTKFMTTFYDCVYRYTHRKISKLFADPVLRFLFEDYINSGMIYEMIETDSTLSKNKEIYQNTVKIFIRSFEKEEYELIKK